MTSGRFRERGDFFVALTVLMHGLLVFVIAGMILIWAPKMANLYGSFCQLLPDTTRMLIWASEFGRSYIFLVLPALLAAVAGDAVFLWYLGRRARPIWSFIWGVGVTCLLVLGLVFVLVSLSMPLFSGMRGVSSTP